MIFTNDVIILITPLNWFSIFSNFLSLSWVWILLSLIIFSWYVLMGWLLILMLRIDIDYFLGWKIITHILLNQCIIMDRLIAIHLNLILRLRSTKNMFITLIVQSGILLFLVRIQDIIDTMVEVIVFIVSALQIRQFKWVIQTSVVLLIFLVLLFLFHFWFLTII